MRKTCGYALSGMFRADSEKPIKAKWIARHEDNLMLAKVQTITGEVTRVFVDHEDVYMDAITGTYYDKTGRCLSSDSLRASKVWLNRPKAKAALMSAKTEVAEAAE